MSGQPVPGGQVRSGDLLEHDGRELVLNRTSGAWYGENGQSVGGLTIECRSGSALWKLGPAWQRAAQPRPNRRLVTGIGIIAESADPIRKNSGGHEPGVKSASRWSVTEHFGETTRRAQLLPVIHGGRAGVVPGERRWC